MVAGWGSSSSAWAEGAVVRGAESCQDREGRRGVDSRRACCLRKADFWAMMVLASACGMVQIGVVVSNVGREGCVWDVDDAVFGMVGLDRSIPVGVARTAIS